VSSTIFPASSFARSRPICGSAPYGTETRTTSPTAEALAAADRIDGALPDLADRVAFLRGRALEALGRGRRGGPGVRGRAERVAAGARRQARPRAAPRGCGPACPRARSARAAPRGAAAGRRGGPGPCRGGAPPRRASPGGRPGAGSRRCTPRAPRVLVGPPVLRSRRLRHGRVHDGEVDLGLGNLVQVVREYV
jgi:hypothetical protein